MFLTSKDIQDLDYFENEPIYCQAHVTDCLVNTASIAMARRVYDETIDNFLDEFHPEMMNDYYV
jgi:hypothetical protein